jgi:hypothetical protein
MKSNKEGDDNEVDFSNEATKQMRLHKYNGSGGGTF